MAALHPVAPQAAPRQLTANQEPDILGPVGHGISRLAHFAFGAASGRGGSLPGGLFGGGAAAEGGAAEGAAGIGGLVEEAAPLLLAGA